MSEWKGEISRESSISWVHSARSSTAGRKAEWRGESTSTSPKGATPHLYLLLSLSLSQTHAFTRHTRTFVRRRKAQQEEHHIHARCFAGLAALWRAVSWRLDQSCIHRFIHPFLPQRQLSDTHPSIIWTDLLSVTHPTADQACLCFHLVQT